MMKKLAAVFVVLLILVGAGAYYLGSNLDGIVKSAVEKFGSAATATAVKLDSVNIEIRSGQASLKGLSVGNPTGFGTEKSLYLGLVSVSIDPKSLPGTGPIVINDVTIEKPQITYEVNNAGESNLQTLGRNAKAYADEMAGGSSSAPAAAKPTEAKNGEGRKIIISNLTVRDGQISISQSLLKGQQLSASLPLIHMTNIGKSSGGASPAEIADQLLGVITASASKIASADLAKQLGSQLNNVTGGVVGGAKDKIGGSLKGFLGQ